MNTVIDMTLISIDVPREQNRPLNVNERAAYHQAGHAVAIYLGNKSIPSTTDPASFRIIIDKRANAKPSSADYEFNHLRRHQSITIEGGRFIRDLPFTLASMEKYLSKQQQQEYRYQLEADICNLLAGPLAEARYVALRDDEVFSPNLVNFSALRYYGGKQDLALVRKYMDCFLLDKQQYEEKLKTLYLAAYHLVNDFTHWKAVTALATFITKQTPCVLEYEEVLSLVDVPLAAYAY